MIPHRTRRARDALELAQFGLVPIYRHGEYITATDDLADRLADALSWQVRLVHKTKTVTMLATDFHRIQATLARVHQIRTIIIKVSDNDDCN